MKLNKKITRKYQYKFNLTKSGLTAIFISARCKSKKQIQSNIDPVIIGSVIYQEQSTNVNFIDTLTDYIGGLFHLNTSIGIGQIRFNTAKALEVYYAELNFFCKNDWFLDCNMVRLERLKDP